MKKLIALNILQLLVGLNICYSQSLRNDGVILKNGQPFFPIGYYAEGFNTLAEHNYVANTLSAAGFNLMYTENVVLTNDNYSTFLDNCAIKGIYNIINFYDPSVAIDAPMTAFINDFKNKPSIFFWGIADDANNYKANDVIRKHNLAKSLDTKLTYQSFYDGGLKLDSTVGIVDVSAMQSYPIFENGNIDRDWDLFREIVSKCKAQGKASIANLQIYKWEESDTYRWPTAAEADVHAYLAIVAGFKGILFYTFKDYGTNSTIDITQTALWNTTKQFAGEVLNPSFQKALLNGIHTESGAANDTQLYYGKWLLNGEEYIVAVNAKNTSASISIPVAGDSGVSLFPNRAHTLFLSGGNLMGTMDAMQIQIYKVTDSSDGGNSGTGNVILEKWSGISGTAVSDIPVITLPTSTYTLTKVEIPPNSDNNYGVRIRGYILPTTTGNYTFYVAGDDNTDLFLSTNNLPENKSRIAYHTDWTNYRQWDKFTTQQSASISLEVGGRYYFEALMKQGEGNDNMSIGWKGPNIDTITIISSTNIEKYIEVLPVNIINFTGKLTNIGNQINWATTNEINNNYFELERKEGNSNEFAKIATIKGAGTTQIKQLYSYLDKNNNLNTCYYRLKQFDFDGKFSYSKTIAIQSNLKDEVSFYPNPFKDEINVVVSDDLKPGTIVSLYNVLGNNCIIPFTRSRNSIKLKTNNLPIGSYVLSIISGQTIYTKIVIKH